MPPWSIPGAARAALAERPLAASRLLNTAVPATDPIRPLSESPYAMPIGTPSVPYRLPGSQYERWVDIYTRLGVERILFLGSEVTDGVANALVAQMLYLDSEDNSKPI